MLSVEQVLEKSKAQKIEDVVRVNLWAQGIEDVSCLSQFTKLRVVTLTGNKISTLKPFSSCSLLQELYLRKNNIQEFKELEHLVGLKELRVLWISENPIAGLPNYRTEIIKLLPQLYKLDENNISAEERMEALGTKDGKKVTELLKKDKEGFGEETGQEDIKERKPFTENAARNILGSDPMAGLKFQDSINLKMIESIDSTQKEAPESGIWK